jgi:hypothetical protein
LGLVNCAEGVGGGVQVAAGQYAETSWREGRCRG